MSEPTKATPNEGRLNLLTTSIQASSALLANLAAAFSWISKYLRLLSLPSGQRVTGIFFSGTLSFLLILLLWRLINLESDAPARSRVRNLFIWSIAAFAGFILAILFFILADGFWKRTSVELAEVIVDVFLPLLFGIAHAFLAAFLCCLGLLAFSPKLGLFRGTSSTERA